MYYIISFNQVVSGSASYKLTNIQEIVATFTVVIPFIDPDLDRETMFIDPNNGDSIGENNESHIDSKVMKEFVDT